MCRYWRCWDRRRHRDSAHPRNEGGRPRRGEDMILFAMRSGRLCIPETITKVPFLFRPRQFQHKMKEMLR